MKLPDNPFKHAIADGRRQVGMWSNLCSPLSAETLAYSGLDWVLIDTEHSQNELPMVVAQLQAMAAGDVTPIVRPPWNDPVVLKRLLDSGAASFLVPFVQNAEEAAAAVAATRYPPDGIRGVAVAHRGNRFGRVTDYFQRAGEEICVLVQVETPQAVAEAGAIAAVEGVDGVFIGPSDLAASLGHLGDAKNPEVQAAIAEAVAAIRAAGKPAGTIAFNESDAEACFAAGFTFVAVGSDLGAVTSRANAVAKHFKG